MGKRIVIIDGHPDSRAERFVHALAKAYQAGAESAGHEVRRISIGTLKFPLLRTSEDFLSGAVPHEIRSSQETLMWANHWLIIFPLWLGSMPAALKAFFEQTLRPGFAFAAAAKGRLPRKLLTDKSARIVVTMGMPALFYRWYYRAHSLKSLERNILAFCGIGPVRASIIGMVEGMSSTERRSWLAKMAALGCKAQ
jgi:putative NADPH-quinone reductase